MSHMHGLSIGILMHTTRSVLIVVILGVLAIFGYNELQWLPLYA